MEQLYNPFQIFNYLNYALKIYILSVSFWTDVTTLILKISSTIHSRRFFILRTLVWFNTQKEKNDRVIKPWLFKCNDALQYGIIKSWIMWFLMGEWHFPYLWWSLVPIICNLRCQLFPDILVQLSADLTQTFKRQRSKTLS